MEDREQLVRDHMKMARVMASRFARRCSHLHRDEYESAAMLGLTQAAANWDPERGPFGKHAGGKIFCTLVNAWRKVKIFGRERSGDFYGYPAYPDTDFEERDALDGMLRPLPARSRELMRLMFVDGLTQKEVAQRMGFSTGTASRLYLESIATLKESLHGRT